MQGNSSMRFSFIDNTGSDTTNGVLEKRNRLLMYSTRMHYIYIDIVCRIFNALAENSTIYLNSDLI